MKLNTKQKRRQSVAATLLYLIASAGVGFLYFVIAARLEGVTLGVCVIFFFVGAVPTYKILRNVGGGRRA